MTVLVVDTCLMACQTAVVRDGVVLAASSEPMERGQQERLAGMVAETLAAADLKFSDLTRIGVTVGPGSFTGLRVGLAFAKGLGVALGIPTVGIGALPALAAGRDGRVAAVLDARRDQIHLQVFDDGAALAEPEAVDIAEAVARLSALAPGRLVGGGASLIAQALPGWALEPVDTPDIGAVALLAETVDPQTAPPVPLYLRGAYA